MSNITQRIPSLSVDAVFDTVRLNMSNDIRTHAGYAMRDGSDVGHLSFWDRHGAVEWSPGHHEAARRIAAGEVAVLYETPIGRFLDSDLPASLRTFVTERDPFVLRAGTHPAPAPTLTTAEQRRAKVEEWAESNTGPRIIALAMVSPKIATTVDALTSRKRHIGQIWWAYVTHIVAAAQHDPWLEHEDIWPAIERALEIDAYEFIYRASANEWNGAAGYMEAYSRIFQADATYLSVAPTHVRLVDETPPVFQQLPDGAPAARRLVYGGDV